ncbi:hypothetical protein GCM10023205_71210 [Yinghuangia aomiensis]|uniref:Uncharacterized protein n=1 Tax=Yinghuangia aomiensis TaxID=676205 RepID=A0ABP9I6T5_9ACTN
MPPTIDGLLLDMNGLFRHWHNTGARTSETLAGLPHGTIDRYAYQHRAYRLARVGILTDQEWADDVTDTPLPRLRTAHPHQPRPLARRPRRTRPRHDRPPHPAPPPPARRRPVQLHRSAGC